MVVICLPSASPTGSEHERTASPFTCTVQAPHCAMPQPYFVPVSPTCSRMTHSNGVVGSTSTLCDFPLMVSAAMKPTSPAHPPVSVRRQLARVEFQVGAVFTSARQGEP